MPAPIGFEYVQRGSGLERLTVAAFTRQHRRAPQGRVIRCIACGWVGTGYGAPAHRGKHEREYEMSAEDYIPLLVGLRQTKSVPPKARAS